MAELESRLSSAGIALTDTARTAFYDRPPADALGLVVEDALRQVAGDPEAMAAWLGPVQDAIREAFGDLAPDDIAGFKARIPAFMASLPRVVGKMDTAGFEEALAGAMLASVVNGYTADGGAAPLAASDTLALWDPSQPRDEQGRWAEVGWVSGAGKAVKVRATLRHPEFGDAVANPHIELASHVEGMGWTGISVNEPTMVSDPAMKAKGVVGKIGKVGLTKDTKAKVDEAIAEVQKHPKWKEFASAQKAATTPVTREPDLWEYSPATDRPQVSAAEAAKYAASRAAMRRVMGYSDISP